MSERNAEGKSPQGLDQGDADKRYLGDLDGVELLRVFLERRDKAQRLMVGIQASMMDGPMDMEKATEAVAAEQRAEKELHLRAEGYARVRRLMDEVEAIMVAGLNTTPKIPSRLEFARWAVNEQRFQGWLAGNHGVQARYPHPWPLGTAPTVLRSPATDGDDYPRPMGVKP